jgi:hypothetical protein
MKKRSVVMCSRKTFCSHARCVSGLRFTLHAACALQLLDEPMLEMSGFVKRLGKFVSGAANQVPWVQSNAQDNIYLNDRQYEGECVGADLHPTRRHQRCAPPAC